MKSKLEVAEERIKQLIYMNQCLRLDVKDWRSRYNILLEKIEAITTICEEGI